MAFKLIRLLTLIAPVSFRRVISGAQIKAGRALVGWSQAELAERAGLSEASIKDIEAENTDPRRSTLRAIVQAFDDAGVIFLDSGVNREGGAGVRLKS